MALTPDEELELLELEEAEYQESLKSTPTSQTTVTPEAPKESKTKKVLKGVAEALPWVGGIGGSFASPIAGTAAGAAAGAGVREAILSSLGEQAPTLEEEVKKVGKEALVGAAFGTVGKGLGIAGKFGKKLIFAPKAAEVAQTGKEALVTLGEKGAEKLALARTTQEAAKKGLIEAEEKAGLHFVSTPAFEKFLATPKKLAQTSELLSRLAKQNPQQLAQELQPETLQLLRKIAQEGEKMTGLSDIAKAQLRQGKDVITQALGVAKPEIGESLGAYRTAKKVVEEIPGQIKESLTKQKLRTAKEVLEAKKTENIRKLVKGALAGAGVYLGARSVFK